MTKPQRLSATKPVEKITKVEEGHPVERHIASAAVPAPESAKLVPFSTRIDEELKNDLEDAVTRCKRSGHPVRSIQDATDAAFRAWIESLDQGR